MTADEYFKSISEDRTLWRSRFSRCMWCGACDILEVHEISRRSAASRAWGVRSNYLLLCGSMSPNRCHEEHFSTMPAARQLAVKFLQDRLHFNLEEWLRIEDPELRAPHRVTQEEILDEALSLREHFDRVRGLVF